MYFLFTCLLFNCFIPFIKCDFHPLYQAMLGDPTLRIQTLTYQLTDGNTTKRNFTSLLAYPNFFGPFHAVIVLPDSNGRDSFEDSKAVALARQGFAALAADIRITESDETQSIDERSALLEQYLLAVQEIRKLPFIRQIASIGFGLGGLVVLDALRLNNKANITAGVCVHPILRPLNDSLTKKRKHILKPRVLMFQGWKDRLNPKETIDQVLRELDVLRIDWQLHTFSQAKHGFAVPISDVGNITQYNAQAAQHAWAISLMFLDSYLRNS